MIRLNKFLSVAAVALCMASQISQASDSDIEPSDKQAKLAPYWDSDEEAYVNAEWDEEKGVWVSFESDDDDGYSKSPDNGSWANFESILSQELSSLNLAFDEAEIIMDFAKGMWSPGKQPRQVIKNYFRVRGGLDSQEAEHATQAIFHRRETISDVMHICRKNFIKKRWPGLSAELVEKFADQLDGLDGKTYEEVRDNKTRLYSTKVYFYMHKDDMFRNAQLRKFLTALSPAYKASNIAEDWGLLSHVARQMSLGHNPEESLARGQFECDFFRMYGWSGFRQGCPVDFMQLAATLAYNADKGHLVGVGPEEFMRQAATLAGGKVHLIGLRQAIEQHPQLEAPHKRIMERPALRRLYYDGLFERLITADQWPGPEIAADREYFKSHAEEHQRSLARQFAAHMLERSLENYLGLEEQGARNGTNFLNPILYWQKYFEPWLKDNFTSPGAADSMLEDIYVHVMVCMMSEKMGKAFFTPLLLGTLDKQEFIICFAKLFAMLDFPAWNTAYDNLTKHNCIRDELKLQIARAMLENRAKSIPQAVELVRTARGAAKKAQKVLKKAAKQDSSAPGLWGSAMLSLPQEVGLPMQINQDRETLLAGRILNAPWPAGRQRPHPVFDVDSTLCERSSEGCKMRSTIYSNFPEAVLVPFYMEEHGLMDHLFFPNIGEMFMTMLVWGWNIDIFSSTMKERNEAVLPLYFKIVLGSYFEEPDTIVNKLMESRIRIYSRCHIREMDKSTYKPGPYEVSAKYKKDLNVLKVPIEDTLLIEDDSSYVTGEDQAFHLKVRSTGAFHFEKAAINTKPERNTSTQQDARHNAAFLLGALATCRDLMGERGHLRPIMQALRILGPGMLATKPTGRVLQRSPWTYASPFEEAEEVSAVESQQVTDFMARGQALIDQLKQVRRYAIPSARGPDPYMDLIRSTYGKIALKSYQSLL